MNVPVRDPRETLQLGAMSPYQWTAVAVTVALCALDGFDVLAISFAAPGIVHEWRVTKAALGLVFSAGLFGMAAGSLLVAPIADLIGRRAVVLVGLSLMILGMAFCSHASALPTLVLWRVVTGLGIGATVATINPLAAEYANASRRDLAVGLMAVGFPIGGVLGGAAAAYVLAHGGWREVFTLGAVAGGVLVPLVLLRLPEPVASLIETPNARSLSRVNKFLRRCGQPSVARLPEPAGRRSVGRSLQIFAGPRLGDTLLITAIYFLFVVTVYFYLNWIPQMVADLGFAPAAASGISATANLAGVAGGTLVGALAGRLGLKRLTFVALVGMGLATMAFAFAPRSLTALQGLASVTGFCLFGGMVGLYAVIARVFPTQSRATGSGFVIGVGRIGSALAPAAAGGLFAAGVDRAEVFMIMGAGAIFAAMLLLVFPVPVSTPATLAPPANA
jgi:AAHS family 4-hydroxybenzoate transporter-like MFS transporter